MLRPGESDLWRSSMLNLLERRPGEISILLRSNRGAVAKQPLLRFFRSTQPRVQIQSMSFCGPWE